MAVFAAGCSASLDGSLDHRACSDDGTCLPGYVCSAEQVCVRSERGRVDTLVKSDAGAAGRSASKPETDATNEDPSADEPRTVAGASGSPPPPTAGMPITRPPIAGTPGVAPPANTAGAPAAGAPSAGAPAAGAPAAGAPAAGGPAPCPDGTRCENQCVDLDRDVANCGGCGRTCDAPEGGEARCESGRCAMACGGSRTLCGRACVDLANDEAHCGSCDKVCKGDRSCEAGVCEKPKDSNGNPSTIDVGELEILLAVFGVTLEEFAEARGVKVSDLDKTEIGLTDLGSVGITIAALSLLGFSEDALKLIGIDVER